jgi:hypothetical protein
MDEIEVHRLQSLERAPERAPAQPAILGIFGHASRGYANYALLAKVRLPLILGSDQQRLNSTTREVLPKGPDGGGDAVDPWEVDVRDVEDAHSIRCINPATGQNPERSPHLRDDSLPQESVGAMTGI